jgi:CheY-like chemotaxis protein
MTDAKPSPQPLAGRSVLIVEDQYLIADEMCALVERLGGTVVGPAPRVSAALAALASRRPDLALLDVNLDGEHIYPVAEALREAGIPFVFMTGYDPWAIDSRFSDAPHLEKPIALPALQGMLRSIGLA